MPRYLLLVPILLALAGLCFYTYLGGFRSPAVTLETSAAPVLLAGQPYQGPADSDGFAPLFRQANELKTSGKIPGDLANLYLNNPEKARDTVQAFVGLAVADTLHPLPAGWRYRVVPAGQRVVVARLRGVSYLLAPGKLYPAALEEMNRQKLTARDFYLERFGRDEQSEVWAGVK